MSTMLRPARTILVLSCVYAFASATASAQPLEVLAHFSSTTGPARPIVEPIHVNGSLIGTSFFGGDFDSGTVFVWDSATASVNVLHSFAPDIEGAHPQGPVMLASDGKLYGTTWLSATGAIGCTTQAGGTVFRLDGLHHRALAMFCAETQPFTPSGRLIEIGGVLYGVLAAGGAHQAGGVFTVHLSTETVEILHEFDAAVEGSGPVAGLTLGSDGLLYGTTTQGGPLGGGTVFRMNPATGHVDRLHAFDFINPVDGRTPESSLVQAGPSLFIGTTTYGGLHGNAAAGIAGGGTVYTVDISTSPPTFRSLRSFEDCCTAPFTGPYGNSPAATLAKGAGGWLYGVNRFGGPSAFHGTIYAIRADGTIRLLHQFTQVDGSAPKGGLTIAADGTVYGTTEFGGDDFHGGTLFRFRADSDGDGVLDPADNCPALLNPGQVDTDGDGIGDGCQTNLPAAFLTLGSLSQTYDGTPKIATVLVDPLQAGVTGLTVTYNGSTTPPTNVGTYTVIATLENPNYAPASITGQMLIHRGNPVITWNTPADIDVNTPLSTTQLNATANVLETSFVYTPGMGSLLGEGSHVLSVVFTPADQGNYNSVTATVTINVRLSLNDVTPPVVTVPGDISVLATEAAGAAGHAVYYPWVGTPLPTLAGFLASATGADDTSAPVQQPTELRNCHTGALLDADVDAATIFPVGVDVNCVRFSFRDAAGNVGQVTRRVTVHPGAAVATKATTPIDAINQQGNPSGVTVEFDEVTAPGTIGATCARNPNSTAPVDIRLDVRPVVSCSPVNPDGTPRSCHAPVAPHPYTIDCDVSTTAQFSGPIRVCFLGTWGAFAVMHYEPVSFPPTPNTPFVWRNVTIQPISSTLPYICGEVSSLSPFVLNAAPLLTLPANIVAEAATPAGTVVSYSVSASDYEEGVLTPTCVPASGSAFAIGTTSVSCSTADSAGETTSGSFTVTVVDTTPPAITITAPADGATYRLNEVVPSAYSCSDNAAGVATCAGPVVNGDAVDTATAGVATFTVAATDRSGNAATATARYRVEYGVCLLYDPTKAKKAGSTIPIKLQLCDAAGRNYSSSSITLTARGVKLVATGDVGPAEDAGTANPDHAFRYDAALSGYIFNLKTTGLPQGVHGLTFTIGDDPTVRIAEFRVR